MDNFVEIADGIWLELETGKYHFHDETFDFNGPYDTRAEAQAALKVYVREMLGIPEIPVQGTDGAQN